MAVSLAFSISVMSSLKQMPGWSYWVQSLCQPSHCHNLSRPCLLISAKEDGSVAIGTFPDYQSDSGEKRTNHLWIFLLQTWSKKWTCSLLPFMTSIHSFSNFPTVFNPHREVVFLTNARTTGNLPEKRALCWFPGPKDILTNAENSLLLGSPSANLWTLRAAVTTMTFLEPQRAQTYVCKSSRLSNTSFWEDGRCYQSSMQHHLRAFLLTHWEARCVTEERHVQQPA